MNKFLAMFNAFCCFGSRFFQSVQRSHLLPVLLLSVVSVAASAAGDTYPKTINFRNIMQNEDIALGEVEAITQDYEGFIWLGGRNALLRYDGYEFLTVNAANDPKDLTQTIPANQVLELFEDSKHNLWAATRSGLYKYDREHEILLLLANAEGVPFFRETIYALAKALKASSWLEREKASGLLIPKH